MASAITDANGEYKLVYIEFPDLIYGAKPGPQIVMITTLLRNDDPGGPTPETLPACYRGRETILAAEVEPGLQQRIDWNLDDNCRY